MIVPISFDVDLFFLFGLRPPFNTKKEKEQFSNNTSQNIHNN